MSELFLQKDIVDLFRDSNVFSIANFIMYESIEERDNSISDFCSISVINMTVMAFYIFDEFVYSSFLQLFTGRQKLPPNCNKLEIDDGIIILIRLINHLSL